MTAPATIHVVDDDASVREGLDLLLQLEGFQVKTYVSGAAFLERIPRGPGAIVLDMRLGDMTGHEVLAVLAERGNSLPVIMLTAYGDIPTTVQAMRAGATDYLTKSDNPTLLVRRIRQIIDATQADEKHQITSLHQQALEKLSPRENEVLQLAVSGLDSAAIAAQLSLSQRTVEAHRSHIVKKFQVGSLADVFRLIARKQKPIGIPPR